MTGQTLGHYQITDKLGEGGMGAVYKARDTKLNRFVAIKVLGGTGGDRKARFLQEAQAASALNHPNIVTVYDFLTHDGHDYIVMEFVPGRTLGQITPRTGLPLAQVLNYGIQISSALTAAHEAGITHRDIKPSNIIVREDGAIKVLDFGLAKLTEMTPPAENEATRTAGADAPHTEEGAILGTIQYMSPEQAEGRKVDARTDVFSFGAVLYEMLTGRRAFQGNSKVSTMAAILKEEPKPPSEIVPDVPREMERLVARCLRKDRERRYQLMKEVKLALEELKEESDSGRLTSSASGITQAAAARPAARWPMLAGVGALVIAGAAGFLWMRSRQAPAGSPQFKLQQLTQDGISGGPALSPDGKLLAFVSRREGQADIWVQQVAPGAQPVRITKHPAADTLPSFSPDSSQIVFSSARDGGGLYVVPALGGEERRLAQGHVYSGRYSPDGKSIAFVENAGGFQTSMWVMPALGGERRQLAKQFHRAVSIGWSEDGKKILFEGAKDQGGKVGLHLADVQSDAISAIEGSEQLPLREGSALSIVSEWTGGFLYYSDRNLFRVPFDSAGSRLSGPPEQLTRGSAREFRPSAVPFANGSGWRIAFSSSLGVSEQLQLLRFDLNAPKPDLKPTALFNDGRQTAMPSLSGDGKQLLYAAIELAGWKLRLRDMLTGQEKTLYQQEKPFRARLSPDGKQVALNLTELVETERTIYLMDPGVGQMRKVCGDCGLIYDWTPDSRGLLYRTGKPMAYFLFDTTTSENLRLISDPVHNLGGATISPDMRWMALNFQTGDGPQNVFLSPMRGVRAGAKSEWTALSVRPFMRNRPAWSPDGKVVYSVEVGDAGTRILAQPVDPASGKPRGEPIEIWRTPEGQSLWTGPTFGPALGGNLFIFPVREGRSNIWLAE